MKNIFDQQFQIVAGHENLLIRNVLIKTLLLLVPNLLFEFNIRSIGNSNRRPTN